MRGRKRITYRPSKSQALFGGVVGIIFVIIGLAVVIPIFGPFGMVWTLFAIGITGMNFYQAFGKSYSGPEIHIEEDDSSAGAPRDGRSAEARLRELDSLRESGLITEEEYDSKRKEILEDI